MVNQMKKKFKKARETDHRFGRANEDKHDFIQSIVLAICDDDDDDNDDDNNDDNDDADDNDVSTTTATKPTTKARLELLGLPSTGYKHMRE